LYVQSHGQRFKGKLMVLLLAPPEAPLAASAVGLRIGYTVSRKVGNAVVRNRVRRRLKEGVGLSPKRFAPPTPMSPSHFRRQPGRHHTNCMLN
jgi:ribonuclease P protein component